MTSGPIDPRARPFAQRILAAYPGPAIEGAVLNGGQNTDALIIASSPAGMEPVSTEQSTLERT